MNLTDKLADTLRNALSRWQECGNLSETERTEIELGRAVLAEFDAQRCGHSACSQHFIDTGSSECVEPGAGTFTIFCRQSDGEGTIYIESTEADSPKEAAQHVLAICADAWGMDADTIDVIGIAKGNVEIVAWQDEPGSGGCDIDLGAQS